MKNVWLIGTGLIGAEYSKVLDALHVNHTIIGRGDTSACKFEEMRPGKKVIRGGLDNFLHTNPVIPECAIVAVGTHDLFGVSVKLMEYGVKRLFVEKPGADTFEKIQQLYTTAKEKDVKVFLAYNRRFYASLLKAEEIIREDGGVTSFNFEFTEWLHVFEAAYGQVELNWIFWANSSHVLDTAFFLGGEPKEISCYTKTMEGDDFPKIFAGAGISDKGALFSYQSNWNAPGRWAVELLTAKHRIYLKPMEQLQLQDKGSVKVYPVEIDDHLDKEFKPGFYLETKAFLDNDTERLCSIEQQLLHLSTIYTKILRY